MDENQPARPLHLLLSAMAKDFAHRKPHDSTSVVDKGQQASGVVQAVDTVAREVSVLLPAGQKTIDVPPDCPIVLRGERIKLRMVQPGDLVRLAYDKAHGQFIARSLEVQPDFFAAAHAT